MKKRKIIGYIEVPNSTCRNCKFRKELWGATPPTECMECGFIGQRNAPYFSRIPVYEDDSEDRQ